MARTRRDFLVGSMAAVATGIVGSRSARGAQAGAAPGAGAEASGSAALLKRNPDHPQPAAERQGQLLNAAGLAGIRGPVS